MAVGNSSRDRTHDNFGIYNVVEYGAKQNVAVSSSAAIQRACDAARAAGGGTVYFPASDLSSNAYSIDTPIWFGSNVRLKGHSKYTTEVSALWNPAFICSQHPTKWNVRTYSYTNTDGGGTVYTTTAGASYNGSNGDWICDGRYRQDLHAFKVGSSITPNYPTGDIPTWPYDYADNVFGLRTRGVCHLRSPGNPMGTGGKQGWHNTRVLTVCALIYCHSTKIIGGIAGCGSVVESQLPDPWLLNGDDTNLNFDIVMTDDSLVERQWARIKFANPSGAGYRRIVVQIDLDAADADKIRVFVDRIRVATEVIYPAGTGLISTSGAAFTTHNRIAPWRWGDFHMGSVYADTTKNGKGSYVDVSDFTIIGLAVWTTALFSTATSIGGYQTLTAAGTSSSTGIGKSVNYSTAGDFTTNPWDDICLPADNTRLNSLGVLYTNIGRSPLGSVDYWFSVRGTGSGLEYWTGGGGNGLCWAFLAPDGNGGSTVDRPEISDMSITGSGGSWNVSTAILLGKSISGTRLERLRIGDGFYCAVGMTKDVVSYPMYMSDCDLMTPGVALMNIIGDWEKIENLNVGYSWGRHIVNVGGEISIINKILVPTPETPYLAFYCFYSIGSTSAGTSMNGVVIDTENLQFNPKLAAFYLEKDISAFPFHTFSKLYIPGSVAPIFVLYDTLSTIDYKWPNQLKVTDSLFAPESPVCEVAGDDWYGSVEVKREHCADSIIDTIDNSLVWNCNNPSLGYHKIETVHEDCFAPPTTGRWTKDCHKLHTINPADGGVLVWGIDQTGTEASDNVPTWSPLVLKNTSRKNVIGGHVFPTFYVKSLAPRPTSSTTALFTGHMSEYWADLILSHIFGGVAAPTMTHVLVKYGPSSYFPSSSTIPSATATSASISNNGSLWGSSSGGTKSSIADVSMTVTAIETVTGHYQRDIILGRAFFALNLGAASPGYAAFFGRTTKVTRGFYDTGSWSIGTGNLQIKQSARNGSFTTTFLDTVSDWMFGGGSFTPPTNFYFGLSTTALAADGTGKTEPAGGSYARTSAMARGSTNWKRVGNQKGLWTIKTNATFPSPTGSWGECIWWFLADASTGGNIIASGPLHKSISPANGESAPIIYPNGITFAL